jgi:hypothetical protein
MSTDRFEPFLTVRVSDEHRHQSCLKRRNLREHNRTGDLGDSSATNHVLQFLVIYGEVYGHVDLLADEGLLQLGDGVSVDTWCKSGGSLMFQKVSEPQQGYTELSLP